MRLIRFGNTCPLRCEILLQPDALFDGVSTGKSVGSNRFLSGSIFRCQLTDFLLRAGEALARIGHLRKSLMLTARAGDNVSLFSLNRFRRVGGQSSTFCLRCGKRGLKKCYAIGRIIEGTTFLQQKLGDVVFFLHGRIELGAKPVANIGKFLR